MRWIATGFAAGFLAASLRTAAQAQTDEIQVYDARIAAPGVFNLTLHVNYTFSGLKAPRFELTRRVSPSGFPG